MKKQSLMLIALFLFAIGAKAQISEGGKPYSFTLTSKKNAVIPTEQMETIDVQKLLEEDAQQTGKKGGYRFAKRFLVEYSTDEFGAWETLADGSRLWRFGIESKGAYSLNITFSKYYMPEGAKLFLYNEEQDHVLGAFTNANNKKSGILPVQPVYGDKLFIELFVPAGISEEPVLEIGQIGHDYRGAFKHPRLKKMNKKSGSCNVNINCPQGQAWQREKRAVCKILIDNTWLCTGTIMNNTEQDGKPYFLTANHCVDHDPTGSGPKILYIFNYENTTCNSNDASQSQSISGSTLRATTGVLDFALYEMSQVPPASYKPYYAGWDNSGKRPTEVTGIHHPGGDNKKICADADGASTSSYGGGYDNNAHWHVPSWDYGTTEGGSSGSALFDQNHRLIGDLTGGQAACGNSINDYYAQFHVSWDKYTSRSEQLKAWLDPNGSGVTTLDGYDPQDGGGDIAVSGVSVTPSSVSIKVGQTAYLSASVKPSNASNKSVSWKSSNTSVATVNNSGVVTAKSKGSATITVKTADGGYTATSSIKITSDGGSNPGDCGDYGVSYVDDNTIRIYHKDEGWTASWSYLCLDGDCRPTKKSDGYFYRDVTATLGQEYTIEFKVQNNATGQYLAPVKTVTFTRESCSFVNKKGILNTKDLSSAISIYPNPVTNIITVKGIDAKTVSKIIDLTGKTVKETKGTTIDVSDIKAGVYMLKAAGKQVTFVKK